MKIRMQATTGIQTHRGVCFGTTDWIKGRTLQIRINTDLQLHEEVTLKLELPDGEGWLMAEARILRVAASERDDTTRAITRITSLGLSDMKRLRRFLDAAERDAPPAPPTPIALHLSRGRLPARGEPPHRRAFMMRIMMPDGFVTTLPAEIGEKIKGGWLVRFLLPHDAFSRMQTFAERRSAEVV